MSMVTILSHSFFFSSWGTVLVTTRCFNWLLLILLIASPLRIPCVTIAMADVAPFSMTTSAALHSVPQVSAMSSTMIAVRPFTLPTKTMRLTSFGRARSLWMSANSVLRLSAIAVALNVLLARISLVARLRLGLPYLFAPPASGETITQSLADKFSRIHLRVLGSA